MSNLSYITPSDTSPWHTYLSQVDRVVPYLGSLARWAETLKRPKRALIVDVPIEMDDGTEGEVKPGDVYRVAPGHDAWTVGDKPAVFVEFQGAANYAKPS